MEQQLTDVP